VGKGSFGSVVLATRRSDGAQFVIKRLPIHNITDREMDAYHNEIKLLSELEHPGIVTYMESFVDRAQMDLCIVMRHCNGGDLAQFIKARQAANKGAGAKLSESDIKSHFVQMALALHYMHEKNILHRYGTGTAGDEANKGGGRACWGHVAAGSDRLDLARLNGPLGSMRVV
jgi:NIMA (never in mitosis gene a)-related kinase